LLLLLLLLLLWLLWCLGFLWPAAGANGAPPPD
jgi:hypothetical protein